MKQIIIEKLQLAGRHYSHLEIQYLHYVKSDAVKLELIEWLVKLEDNVMLDRLMFLKKNSETTDWADQLTAEQKKAIEAGLEDIEAGRTISNEKVWAKYGRKV